MTERSADVLVVGAGAAGMYAAIEASRAGASVILLDKSKIGRGGATVMAQMTVAAALGHAEPDDPQLHLADTLTSGKGLTNVELATLLCEEGPMRILDSLEMGVPWARADDGRLDQVVAPGHSRRRCCYVGALQTGSGVTRGLRKELRRQDLTALDGMFVTRLVVDTGGAVVGAVALDIDNGQTHRFWAPSVVLACGGLTELYERNSASLNMTGDAYPLALDAGAELVDMEMVQFFPIANLAPRLIGLDPIMWDPFRYRLGGRLLNGRHEPFLEGYAGVADEGTYTATRDVATYAILKEVEAGRGSPAGGAFLDFTDLDRDTIRQAFPVAFDRLIEQGIDISERAVEVAPTAHYTIGGVRVDGRMRTGVPGLFAAGESVGGAHGANRLSGNAITETFVFGARAGRSAAEFASQGGTPDAAAQAAAAEAIADVEAARGRRTDSPVFLPELRARLQQIMWRQLGPFRDEDGMKQAGEQLAELADLFANRVRVGANRTFNLEWKEYFELRGMLRSAEAVRVAALARRESRGAHQREDYPAEDDAYLRNTVVRSSGPGGAELLVDWAEPVHATRDNGRAVAAAGTDVDERGAPR